MKALPLEVYHSMGTNHHLSRAQQSIVAEEDE
jgi:hypothetical protein